MGIVKWTFIISTILVAYISYKLVSTFKSPSSIISLGDLGSLEGVVSNSREGREFSEYLGIPYAKPPVGTLRFEPPQNPEPWTGLIYANSYGPECVQLSSMTGGPVGDENCLFLNIFVPKRESENVLLPVMFFIHGGAFYEGSANFYRPDYFMDHDIILVTINYRLSALGFLNTGDNAVKGNMGLKDQQMALKWVNKNINFFGGDANQVTIFGESAGGASAHMHMMSPLSKGLFSRAISQSGTAFQPRAFFGGDTSEQARRLARQHNCTRPSTSDMVNCLRLIPSHQFITFQQAELKDPLKEQISLYVPTIETIQDVSTFLNDHPYNMVSNLKSTVPWMTGVNSQEGLLVEASLVRNETFRHILTNDWMNKLPFFLHLNPKYTEVAESIKEFYFKSTDGTPKHLNFEAASENYTNLLSDRFFVYGFHEAVKLHVEKSLSPTFTYYFNYEGEFSIYPFLIALKGNYSPVLEVLLHFTKNWMNKVFYGIVPPRKGVCHADELQYLFRLERMNDIFTKEHSDYDLSKEFVRLWVSFAKQENQLHFNQVPWNALEKSSAGNEKSLTYLNIDKTASIIKEPFEERMKFWDRFKDYYWGRKN